MSPRLAIAAASLFALAACGPAASSTPAAPGTVDTARIPDAVAAEVAAGRPVRVLVLLDRSQLGADPGGVSLLLGAEAATDRVLRFATAKQDLFAAAPAGLAVEQDYDQLPLALATIGSQAALDHLSADPRVLRLAEDALNTTSLAQSLPLIAQPATAAEGKDGAGTSIAVLDTGADYRVADLGSCTSVGTPASCRVAYAHDFATEDNQLDDSGRHGTNTSSISASVAPGAQILALDVFDGQGAYTSVIVSAINWVIANRGTYHIASMNLSLGGGSYTGHCDGDPMAVAIAEARNVGVLAAVATGNSGTPDAVSSPACGSAAVSVGAVYDSNLGAMGFSSCRDAATASDQVTCFSNSASFQTLLAPGALITAGGVTMAGTSQATPHVAGALAVLRGAFPAETPTELVTRLTSSGKAVTDARQGRVLPRLDLHAAAAGCVYRLSPATLTLPSSDSTGTVTLATSSGCAWSAAASAGWLSVSPTSGTGPATLTLHAGLNSGALRTATLTLTGTGATATAAVSQGVDAAAPTGTVTINGGATWTRTTTVALAISASDPSGVAELCVTSGTACTTYEPYASARAFTLAAGSGSRTVRVFFKDGRGNVSALAGAASATIGLDTGLPTGALATATAGDTQVTLGWTQGVDAVSGLAGYTVVYATGTTAPTSCALGTVAYQGTALGFTHTGLTNGTSYAYRVCARDLAGNFSAGSTQVAAPRPEWNGPVPSLTINGGASVTSTPAVTLGVSGADASRITQMCLSTSATSCTAWEAFAPSRRYTLPVSQGLRTVYLRLKDEWGNPSAAPASAAIVLDTLAPVMGSTITAAWANASVVLTWAAGTDVTTGVVGAKVVYAVGATAPATCQAGTLASASASSPYTVTGLANGTKYAFRVCSVDGAGNVATGLTASAMPKPEADGPTGTVTINGGAAITRTTSASLTLTATDASRVASMCVSSAATCSAWETFAASKTYTLPATQGTRTVYVAFRDEWGNVSASPATATIVLDTVAPTGGVLTASYGNAANTLSWTAATDATTGVAGYTVVYATGATPPASCAAGTVAATGVSSPYVHQGLTNGTAYAYRVCPVDVAGNVGTGLTASATPKPESMGPVGSIVLAGGAAWTRTAAVAVAVSATDASTITKMCLTTSATACTSWVAYAASATVSLPAGTGTRTVYAWFKDTWGNVSAAPAAASIGLDTSLPTQPALTASAGAGRANTLSWTAPTDVGSGVASTKLVVLPGTALPATGCATGTVLSNDGSTSFTHTGLTAGASYAYRLCAVDVAGNVSAGATVVLKALP